MQMKRPSYFNFHEFDSTQVFFSLHKTFCEYKFLSLLIGYGPRVTVIFSISVLLVQVCLIQCLL